MLSEYCSSSKSNHSDFANLIPHVGLQCVSAAFCMSKRSVLHGSVFKMLDSTLRGKKILHPLYFLNNFVKPRSMLIIFWHADNWMNFPSDAYFIFFVHSSTENQFNIPSFYMVADDNINYRHKFIMLYSKQDRILIRNLHVLKGCDAKN